jgi:hypothetical protein
MEGNMKKLILALGLAAISAIGLAQSDGKVVRRIQIRHADPQLIFMLLSGTTNFQTPPEMSTLQFGFGGFGGNGGFGGSGFGGGNNGFSGGNGGFGSGFGGGNGRGSSSGNGGGRRGG